MLVVPPKELGGLVSIVDGDYRIDDSASDEQVQLFNEWVEEVKKLESDE